MLAEESAPSTRLNAEESVELASALTASVASEAGIRCLFIKGSAAVAAKMRPVRASADTDVLVHPEDVDSLVLQLAQRGWKLRPFAEGMGIPKHSHTAYHPQWGCDIDIHFRFPGLDADPSAAFEVLDRDCSVHRFAGVPAKVPARAGMLVVQATHALRNRDENGDFSQAAKNDYEFLLCSNHPVKWEELCAVLNGTGSWAAMKPFLFKAYPEHVRDIDFPQPSEDWKSRTINISGGMQKLVAFFHAPWKNKPRILFRSVIPSREDLAVGHLPLLEANRRTLARYRGARLLRIALRVPILLRQTKQRFWGERD